LQIVLLIKNDLQNRFTFGIIMLKNNFDIRNCFCLLLPVITAGMIFVSSANAQLSELIADKNTIVTVPIFLSEEDEIRGIDIIVTFDTAVLTDPKAELTGGILDFPESSYYLSVNTKIPGEIKLFIYGSSELVTGKGNAAVLTFNAAGPVGGTSVLSLKTFECNEIAVSAASGFRVNNTVVKEVNVRITGPLDLRYAVSALKVLTGMTTGSAFLDMTGDKKTGMEDVIHILQAVAKNIP
jgi:hypothetical protein